ncbi:MAG TPA: SEC-C metal-binding domain-containing protein, partial [Patescibacteria group bacterium]|nr:SEC-C metal-binding domain-containing protein [Patescibacteria group bacterium]
GTEKYYQFAKLIERLHPSADYTVDEKLRTANLTETGIVKIEQWLHVDNLYEKDFETVHHIEEALKANVLFQKDRDYVVKDDQVIIVDEFTGRLMPGRRYSEGLHQAIEAKEGVAIQRESRTLATISFQNYFRMYEKLAGMTGTAATESQEFHEIYKLDVVIVPTNKPMVREDLVDVVYKTTKAKFSAVADAIEECYKKGRPVLIGTTSIDKNELVATLLKRRGVPHQVLNAKNHEREAAIIAQAGQKGAVTVATNIAGRGVDIKLGKDVVKLGGLHIIGTDRHESRRVDNQLRGRSGRQGDPGSSRFYVSLEDDIMRLFGGDQVARVMSTFRVPENTPLEHPMVSKIIEQAQIKVETFHFDARKHVVQYDDVMNKQREIVYKLRRKVLEVADREIQSEKPVGTNNDFKTLKAEILKRIDNQIELLTLLHTKEDTGELQYGDIVESYGAMIPFDAASKSKILQDAKMKSQQEFVEFLRTIAHTTYDQKEKQIGEEEARFLEKFVLLSVIDSLWVEHLDSMEDMQQGIGLQGYAQRDPLVQYKSEAFRMFELLMDRIDFEIAHRIYRVGPRRKQPLQTMPTNITVSHPQAGSPLGGNQVQRPSQQTTVRKDKKVGRNDPCPCGSGKKYKKCHYPQFG